MGPKPPLKDMFKLNTPKKPFPKFRTNQNENFWLYDFN